MIFKRLSPIDKQQGGNLTMFKNLSWNLRILLGIVALVIVAILGFVAYYNILRLSLDEPPEVDVYPNSELLFESTVREGWEQARYVVDSDDPLAIERFYQEQGFECRTLSGDLYPNGRLEANVYIRSACLLDRSHSLGFRQTVQLDIQPIRTPYVYENDDPTNLIIGGGELTGEVVMDFQFLWGNDGLLGG